MHNIRKTDIQFKHLHIDSCQNDYSVVQFKICL
jgi:hypothetical protein